MTFEDQVRELQRRIHVPDDGNFGPVSVAAALEVVPPLPVATHYTYGGASVRKGVDRDPANLVPVFADRVELLFARMRAHGFEPFLWEGYRTQERSALLHKRGTGILDSMHCYGLAVDIVDSDDTPWDAPPRFWAVLRGQAMHLGLHVLFDPRTGQDKDLPHVQAIAVADQGRIRALANSAERAAFVAMRLGHPPLS